MRGRRKMSRFFYLREKIEKEIAENQEIRVAREVGAKRENLVSRILEELRKEKFIRDFVAPGTLSYSDVEKGTDIFVIKVNRKYTVIPLSITGERWVKKHKGAHPEIPIIEVNGWENDTIIKNRIMDAIARYE